MRGRPSGATTQLTVRDDSASYRQGGPGTAAKFDVRFSVTAWEDRRVLAAIDKDTWQPFPYGLSTPEVCGADIAETVLFARQRHPARPLGPPGRRQGPPDARLAAGAVHHLELPRRHHRPRPPARRGRGRPPPAHGRRAEHRRAQERRAQAPAVRHFHGPRLACADRDDPHNLCRTVGQLAGPDLERATAATLRRKVFTVPARLVHSRRRRHLRLPTH